MQKLSPFKKLLFSKEVILIFVTTIIILFPLLLHPYSTIFPFADVTAYTPWKLFLKSSFYHFGYIPLWNPYYLAGAPFIGNSQVGFFYPINILYFVFPIGITFNLIFVLDFFLLAVFTFLYARLIGLGKNASLISGICMAFNGTIMGEFFLGHIMILDSLTWFPLLMYLFEKTIKNKNLKYSVIAGIILGLMVLAGNPQIALYALIAGSIYYLVRLFQERNNFSLKQKICFLLSPLIIALLGILISAIQILPSIEFSQVSSRTNGLSFAFGRYGLIFKLSFNFIPFLNEFRVPTRFLFVYEFSFAIFAAYGYEYLLKKINNNTFLKRLIKILLLIFFSSISLFLIMYLNSNNISLFETFIVSHRFAQNIDHHAMYLLIVDDLFIFSIFISLLCITFIFIKLKRISISAIFTVIVCLIVIDFFVFYSKFFNVVPPNAQIQISNEIKYLKQDKSYFRIFTLPTMICCQASENNLENVSELYALYPNLYRNFLWKIGHYENMPFESFVITDTITDLNPLRLLNVKYILSEEKISNKDLLYVFKDKYYIYKVLNTLPRAYIDYSTSPNYLPDENNRVQEAKIIFYQPNKIILSVNLNKPGFLILSELFYPGWEAFDNSKPIKIIPSNKIFRSVFLNPGSHNIQFIYNPKSYSIGKIITFLTILILVIYFAFIKRKFLTKRH